MVLGQPKEVEAKRSENAMELIANQSRMSQSDPTTFCSNGPALSLQSYGLLLDLVGLYVCLFASQPLLCSSILSLPIDSLCQCLFLSPAVTIITSHKHPSAKHRCCFRKRSPGCRVILNPTVLILTLTQSSLSCRQVLTLTQSSLFRRRAMHIAFSFSFFHRQ